MVLISMTDLTHTCHILVSSLCLPASSFMNTGFIIATFRVPVNICNNALLMSCTSYKSLITTPLLYSLTSPNIHYTFLPDSGLGTSIHHASIFPSLSSNLLLHSKDTQKLSSKYSGLRRHKWFSLVTFSLSVPKTKTQLLIIRSELFSNKSLLIWSPEIDLVIKF